MKHKVLLFVLLSIIGFNKGGAYDFEADGIYYNILSEDSLYVEVTGGDSLFIYEGDIVIPKSCEYNNKVYTVKSIGMMAFYVCTKLTNVVIPEGVTDIKELAFDYCTGLQSISLPSTLITVGRAAFASCEGLTSVSLSDGIVEIKEKAFAYCSKLPSISIPATIENIGKDAFYACSSLKKVYVSDIKDWLKINFSDYTSNPLNNSTADLYIGEELLSELIIPDEIEEIKDYSFCDCKSLQKIICNEELKIIGLRAFCGCSNLSEITLSKNISSIKSLAFDCKNLNRINIYDYRSWLETDYAFNAFPANYYTKLYINNELFTDFNNLPKDLTKIGDYSLAHNTLLTDICIPESVKSIGGAAFVSCDNLNNVTFKCEALESVGVNLFNNINHSLNITFDCETITSQFIFGYENVNGYNIIFSDKVKNIGPRVFNHYNNIFNEAIIGKNVAQIGVNSFSKIKNLIIQDLECWCNIDFEDYEANPSIVSENILYNDMPVQNLNIDIKEIKPFVFYNFKDLENITFGKSIRAIGDRAFYYCENLKTINVPDIGTWCQIKFDDNYSNPLIYAKNLYINNELAENIIIPDYINSINPYAFVFCESLKSVVLPLSIKEIGRYAFHDCINLKEINFPPNLTKISHGGFSGSGLVDVKIGSNITLIDEDGFSYCANLKTIDIDAQTIYMEGVMNCESLSTIIFRENVKNIMSSSFEDCPEIKDVYCYNMNPPQCSRSSFSFNSNPTLHIPKGTLEEYKSKYAWYYFKNIIEDIELDSSGIEYLECEDNENIKIYDLHGHIIETEINSLMPGIYIVNNKKILVR